jgi:hypothetical protein
LTDCRVFKLQFCCTAINLTNLCTEVRCYCPSSVSESDTISHDANAWMVLCAFGDANGVCGDWLRLIINRWCSDMSCGGFLKATNPLLPFVECTSTSTAWPVTMPMNDRTCSVFVSMPNNAFFSSAELLRSVAVLWFTKSVVQQFGFADDNIIKLSLQVGACASVLLWVMYVLVCVVSVFVSICVCDKGTLQFELTWYETVVASCEWVCVCVDVLVCGGLCESVWKCVVKVCESVWEWVWMGLLWDSRVRSLSQKFALCGVEFVLSCTCACAACD